MLQILSQHQVRYASSPPPVLQVLRPQLTTDASSPPLVLQIVPQDLATDASSPTFTQQILPPQIPAHHLSHYSPCFRRYRLTTCHTAALASADTSSPPITLQIAPQDLAADASLSSVVEPLRLRIAAAAGTTAHVDFRQSVCEQAAIGLALHLVPAWAAAFQV